MTVKNEEATVIKKETGGGISIRIIGAIAIVIAILLAFFTFTLASQIAENEDAVAASEKRYIECDDAIEQLREASDYLTTQARIFVTTGRAENMQNYLDELNVTDRRGHAVDTLRTSTQDDQGAVAELSKALEASDELAWRELAAMRLAASYYKIEDVPDEVASTEVDASSLALRGNAQLNAARELVLNRAYDEAKAGVWRQVDASSNALLEHLNATLEANKAQTRNLLFQLRTAVALLLCVVMVLVLVLFMYVLKPLGRYIKRVEKSEPLEPEGAYELCYLANAYNAMYEDNNKRIEQLRALAERDSLTGISNRSGYDSFLATHTRNIALILIDIDNFKEFNGVYGRDTGDAVMVKLAGALSKAFRSTDFPCRIESDKFAVVMTNMNADLHDAVVSKIELVNSIMADDSDDLPVVTLSVGAAFSAVGMDDSDIYRAANEALIQAQETGGSEVVFYGEYNVASQA